MNPSVKVMTSWRDLRFYSFVRDATTSTTRLSRASLLASQSTSTSASPPVSSSPEEAHWYF